MSLKTSSNLVKHTILNSKSNIKNNGTGAGGLNTNKNGLSYEYLTKLDDLIIILKKNKYSSKIRFINYSKIFIRTKQSNLFKYMKDEIDTNIVSGHGCKNPDDCYIDNELKNIFIVEKKISTMFRLGM